jgi:hypothetical protein
LTKPTQSCIFIEASCGKLQGIFDPQGSAIHSNRSLTPQQAMGNALAPGFSYYRQVVSGALILRAASEAGGATRSSFDTIEGF